MKKKIAFVMTEIETGGVSEALIEMLKHFDYSLYHVTIWVCKGTGIEQHRLDSRAEIRHWGNNETLFSTLKNGQVFSFIRQVIYRILGRCNIKCNDKHAFFCIRSYADLDTELFDYIICYQGVSPLALPNALYRIPGRKRILWVHGDLGRQGKEHSFCKKLYNRFDGVVAVSKAACDLFVKQYDYPIDHTMIFQNLIDPHMIVDSSTIPPKISIKHSCIVTVGRLSPEKGQQMIPETAQMLVDAGYDIHWYLVGDGPLREEVEREIEKHGVSDRVVLLGTQSNPYPYIKNCDIYVQPSFSEGWGLTVQEARILHKPIVTTPVPVFGEQIVSGENGLIVDAMTPEALFEGIKTLIDHPEMREKFVENLKNEGYDNSKELQKLYDFIES